MRAADPLISFVNNRCLRIVTSVLKEEDVDVADVDKVVMASGSTRTSILRTKVFAFSNGKVSLYPYTCKVPR